MKLILVTGANKGIGQAIVMTLLRDYPDTHLLLGSRDLGRGQAAVSQLTSQLGEDVTKGRLDLLELDVSKDESVAAAVKTVRDRFGADGPLFGLVNNAGAIMEGVRKTVELNTYGLRRVCEAFLPLIQPAQGRIVQISSAAGPSYVADCKEEMQAFLVGSNITWDKVEQKLLSPALALAEDSSLTEDSRKEALTSLGLGDLTMSGYGLSKAAVNAYTLHLVKRFPNLLINSCTPGFIETDLTKIFAAKSGKTPAEMGMLTPEMGARVAVYLTMTNLPQELNGYQSGWFYGSDSKRSPLHKYRSPGSEPYQGEFP